MSDKQETYDKPHCGDSRFSFHWCVLCVDVWGGAGRSGAHDGAPGIFCLCWAAHTQTAVKIKERITQIFGDLGYYFGFGWKHLTVFISIQEFVLNPNLMQVKRWIAIRHTQMNSEGFTAVVFFLSYRSWISDLFCAAEYVLSLKPDLIDSWRSGLCYTVPNAVFTLMF